MVYTKKTVFLSSEAGRIELARLLSLSGLEQGESQWGVTSGYLQDGALLGNGRYTERSVALSFDLESKEAVQTAGQILGKRKITLEILERYPGEDRTERYYLYPCRTTAPLSVVRRGKAWYSCSVQLSAADPYIQKETEDQTLAQEDARKIYRNDYLWYPEDALVLSANRMEVAVYNEGDADAPMEIRFLGPADQPYILNMDTGEKLGVNQVLEAGEYMDISTAYGQKRITITRLDGVTHNAFHYIQAGCVFFQLHPGANRLRYGSAGTSGAALAGVRIRYDSRFSSYML